MSNISAKNILFNFDFNKKQNQKTKTDETENTGIFNFFQNLDPKTEETTQTTTSVTSSKAENQDKGPIDLLFDFLGDILLLLFGDDNNEPKRYYPLENISLNSLNDEEKGLLDDIQKAQDSVGICTIDNDNNVCLTIDIQNSSEDMGISLGDVKELFGIKDSVIRKKNPELFENKNNLPYNLDEFVVTSGTQIKLSADDITLPDFENYEYTLHKVGKSSENNEFNLENAKTSDDMIKMIEEWESFHSEAYKCPSGVWTIGYGHTKGVLPGDVCSKEEAEEYLKQDIEYAENVVKEYVKNGTITFDLNQNQFDALTSFTFNCGEGNLAQLTNKRTPEKVAEKMCLYYYDSNKNIQPGLVIRRQAESEWFLS